MKGKLIFKLPKEEVEHRQALDGYKWESVVFNLQSDCMKHGYLNRLREKEENITTETILRLISDHMEEQNLEFSP